MATKTRRPVVVHTPKATPSNRKAQQVANKQAVLDNFDLEVAHRTRNMRIQLETALSKFAALAEADLMKIPSTMRTMTLGELEKYWAGSFAETSRAIAEKRFENAHPMQDEAEVMALAVEGKRKRDVMSPGDRLSKNPRIKSTITPAAKKRTTKTTKRAKPPPLPLSSSASTLPQDHIFNPLLPKTPRFARAPKRNESFFSENGSPVDIKLSSMGLVHVDDTDNGSVRSLEVPVSARSGPTTGSSWGGESGDGDGEEEEVLDDEDDELPDPAKMERAALAQSTRPRGTPLSKGMKKRGPSLLFRSSLGGPGSGVGSGVGPAGQSDDEADSEHRSANIPLSDGRTISFNPLNLTPGRIDDELAQGGLGDGEKKRVKTRVQEEVVRALTERMERWKAL